MPPARSEAAAQAPAEATPSPQAEAQPPASKPKPEAQAPAPSTQPQVSEASQEASAPSPAPSEFGIEEGSASEEAPRARARAPPSRGAESQRRAPQAPASAAPASAGLSGSGASAEHSARSAFRAEGGYRTAPSRPSGGSMARKRDDVFIIGAESPSSPTDGRSAGGGPPQAEPRNAFAPAPPVARLAGRAGGGWAPAAASCSAAWRSRLIAGARALASLRGGGGTGTPAAPARPPASEPLVAAPGPRHRATATPPSRPGAARGSSAAAARPAPGARRARDGARATERTPRARARRGAAGERGPCRPTRYRPRRRLRRPRPHRPQHVAAARRASAPSPATAVAPSRPEFSFER